MELRQLKTFCTVARLSSFNRAAETLNYAQSTVSAQIKLLEEEFGVPLFDRLGRNVKLTEAGQMLMRYSRRMLDLEAETRANVAGWEEPHGAIAIRIPQSIGTHYLPEALSRFRKRYPRVGFDVSTCAYDVLQQELRTGITDVAFLLTESIHSAELKSELLGVVDLVLVASAGHALAGNAAVNINDLAGEPLILPKHDCSYKMGFEQVLTEAKVVPATMIELNSVESIKQCVLKGVGIAMLPRIVVEKEIRAGQLAVLPCAEMDLEAGILMIWHRNKWISPTLGAFMDTMREVVRGSV